MNEVGLIGEVDKDPVLYTSRHGQQTVSFILGIDPTWKDKTTAQEKEWHRISVFRRDLCRYAVNNLKKGVNVYLLGQLRTRKWEDKEKRILNTTEIILSSQNAALKVVEFPVLLNEVTLIGEVDSDPVIYTSRHGQQTVTFILGIEIAEWKDKTEWHHISVFGRDLCGYAANNLKKGAKVYLVGQLRTRKWEDKEKNILNTTEIILSSENADLKVGHFSHLERLGELKEEMQL